MVFFCVSMPLGGWGIGEDLEKGSLSASSANDPFLVDSSSDSSDESDEESSDISDEEESTPTAAPYTILLSSV